MISAEIIADSRNPWEVRLTTFLLTYPRFIHSELNTHRAFSRNAASSRAIPIEKMVRAVIEEPAMPERYGSNQPGMQAGEVLDATATNDCMTIIRDLRREAASAVRELTLAGLHKQWANRYIEPWGHITVIVSSTERGLANFFAQRAHPDAQPEFTKLAFKMLKLYVERKPIAVPWGAWHLPFDDSGIIRVGDAATNIEAIREAVGRCARVSYLRQDSNDREKNAEVYDKCARSGHFSPFEHVANAWGTGALSNFDTGYTGGDSALFRAGWNQFRKTFREELRAEVNYTELLETCPKWLTL